MKTISTKFPFKTAFLAATLSLFSQGCGKSDIEPYSSENKLWFTQYARVKGDLVDVSEQKRSFSHYPQSTETLDIPFQVNLMGDFLEEDRQYKAVVVDSLTTADPSDYQFHSMIFRAHQAVDTLWVRIFKTDHLKTDEVKLTLYLVENENFGPGYSDRLSVRLIFNNIPSKPEWWTKNIEESYLGPYTSEKFEAFYAFSGLLEIGSDVPPSVLRKMMHEFRAYIEKNDIREADGSPMTIPVM